ncbi:MAG: adenosylcobinamide-GDP ribazoletransferase, partial [Pseudomonadota bacterium]
RRDGLAAGLITADGVAAEAARLPRRLAVSVLVTGIVAVSAAGLGAVLALAAALIAAGAVALTAARRLGGHTGDSFGAAAAVGETAALIALVAVPPAGALMGLLA